MIIFYVSFIIFDGMLLSSSQLNRTAIKDLQIPDFWTLQNIAVIEYPNNVTEVNSTTTLTRHKRSLLHRGRRDKTRSEEHSRNIVDADKVDSTRSEVKIVDVIDSEEKTSKIADSDDSKKSKEEKISKEEHDKHRRFVKTNHRKRGASRSKRKHHTKRVAKKNAKPAVATTSGRGKRSFVRDRYVGDTLFALELFLLFIPLACVTVVVLSLLHVCWSRTCKPKRDSDSQSEWTSEVKVTPAVDVTPKKKMNDIVSELVTNDVMAGGDAPGKKEKLCPTRKKSSHKRVPVAVEDNNINKAAAMSSTTEPPKSSSSLFVVHPLRVEGGPFPSTATFNSHAGDTRGRRSLRLKAFINHHQRELEEETKRNEAKFEGRSSLRPEEEEEESPPRREVNKKRHKTKSNPIEESSLSSSFQYPNYYHHDDKFYHMEQ